jgi:hypothetical protein
MIVAELRVGFYSHYNIIDLFLIKSLALRIDQIEYHIVCVDLIVSNSGHDVRVGMVGYGFIKRLRESV